MALLTVLSPRECQGLVFLLRVFPRQPQAWKCLLLHNRAVGKLPLLHASQPQYQCHGSHAQNTQPQAQFKSHTYPTSRIHRQTLYPKETKSLHITLHITAPPGLSRSWTRARFYKVRHPWDCAGGRTPLCFPVSNPNLSPGSLPPLQ